MKKTDSEKILKTMGTLSIISIIALGVGLVFVYVSPAIAGFSYFYALVYSIIMLTNINKLIEGKFESKTSDIVDELTKLAQLKDKGILTEDEFNAKKISILRGE